jgi:hypothetical protein
LYWLGLTSYSFFSKLKDSLQRRREVLRNLS